MHSPTQLGAMLRLAGVTAALLVASACAQPRIITGMTSSGDSFKIVYTQKRIANADTGIVQCRRQEDGSLANCRRLNITWSDGKNPNNVQGD